MYTFLLVILILISLVLIAAVLLQAGKGGGLAASFGGASSSSDAFMGTRQAGNLLTKISWYGGGLFLLLSFVLQLMSVRTRVPTSVLDQPFSATPTAPATPKATTPPPTVVPLQDQSKQDSTTPPTPKQP
jgi:preprotein translocase subunit SecG